MKTCKLYEVPSNTVISVQSKLNKEIELLFHHIDGMYSYCTIPGTKEVVHLAAWTEVTYDDSSI